ncbi:bifunctional DNA primase/polymerase [Paracoccus methylarcula]|uniref:DNA primase/polymerase bifunctional N-terminal domain-containing protein n=1 Tax=Paracoccus methylarcula TaxID=72022 RepID=A0A422QUI9_9RHOB|nr:bifunctional DNA primase/polymerase [Paracoccus methylarcula]RNF33707.1 hypothetical protein A7A09_014550 [Paracoccus methylarcula]
MTNIPASDSQYRLDAESLDLLGGTNVVPLRIPTNNRDAALHWAERGHRVLFLRDWGDGDGRKPFEGWQRGATTSAEVINGWWDKYPDAIPALLCDNKVVLDVDVKHGNDGIATLRGKGFGDLAALSPSRTRTKSGGYHLFFEGPDDRVKNWVGEVGPGLDTRCNSGGLVIAPYATIEGKQYVPEGAPLGSVALPRFPDELVPEDKQDYPSVEAQEADEEQREWAADHLRKLASNLAATPLGERHGTLNAAALWAGGAGAHKALTQEQAMDALLAACRKWPEPFDERKERGKIERAWRDGLKKPVMLPGMHDHTDVFEDQGEPEQREEKPDLDCDTWELLGGPDVEPKGKQDPRVVLNDHHAVVSLGGKTAIMTIEGDRVAFGNPADLKLRYQNRRHGKRTLAEAWLEWSGRQEYPGGVVFRPDGRAPVAAYNLWRGWAIEPKESASCHLFLDHLRNVICNGHRGHYEWILCWMAHMVQRPAEKPRSAIVLRGEKGAGKDIVASYLSRLMHESAYLNTADQESVWGHFNGAIANKLFIHLEEAFFHGDHGADSRVKNLITANKQTINEKHAPVYSVESFHRLWITSNEFRPVNATSGERRYFISEVSDEQKGNSAYFDALVREMNGDGPSALMHLLMHYDLTGWHHQPPATEALLDTIAEGLRGVQAWMADCIEAEGIVAADRALLWRGEPIETDRLRDAFEGWASKPGNRYRTQQTSEKAFGKQIAPFLAKRRFKEGPRDDREWYYLLKSPEDCRKVLDSIISKGNQA